MRILLTGGTGFIGSSLLKALIGHRLWVLTRHKEKAQQQLAHLCNKQLTFIEDLDELPHFNELDVIINLAGEPIADKRWSPAQKHRICESRWQLTEQLVQRIQACSHPPRLFISGSATGYYGHQNNSFNEDLLVTSQAFAHQVCQQWENIALNAQSEHTRVCLLRTGMVLAPHGGALKKLLPLYRFGLGAVIGTGQQYVPWIHLDDVIAAIVFLIHHEQAQGAINLCAPHPVTYQTFSHLLAKQLHRPDWLRLPRKAIQLLMGEASQLVLDSCRARPQRLTEYGFYFRYPRLESALKAMFSHS